MKVKKNSMVIMALLLLPGCIQEATDADLPILASTWIDENGNEVAYLPPFFKLTDQHNNTFTSDQLEGKIHIVDFFFTSCPTICPKMTNHLKIVQDHFLGNENVTLISFSIDPIHDTPTRLNTYAQDNNIVYNQWKLLNDKNRQTILDLSKEYKVRAFEESSREKTNLLHDGTFVLLDKQARVRGYYDGLASETPKQLIKDIEKLLKNE